MGIIKNFIKGNRHKKDVTVSREAIGNSIALIVVKKMEENSAYPGIQSYVFATQVMNYLMGTYIDSILDTVTPDIRVQIVKIKDNVVPKYSMKLLQEDKQIREAVILSLQHTNIVLRAHSSSEATYMQRPERRQIMHILDLFANGQEYPSNNETIPLLKIASAMHKRANLIYQ